MEAIILAGGKGTRLQPVVSGVPKPMAPIHGRPFLEYLLKNLANGGVHHIILSVGYKRQSIIDYFGNEYAGMKINYAIEESPLGTGGALKAALRLCRTSRAFVLNGDTYFDVEFMAMRRFSENVDASLVMAVKEMGNFERYGCLEIEDGYLTAFLEKKFCTRGYINGGIYDVSVSLLERVKYSKFSFERDFLEKYVEKLNIPVFVSDGYFVDIGVPEDYLKAQREFLAFD